MRRGDTYSRRGESVELLLFLFGATLLFSVPVISDASPIIKKPDAPNDRVPELTLRDSNLVEHSQ
jgi:hypothetical protein